MRNWGQLLLMLGLASVLIIEAVGLTKDSESDFDPVSLRSFSVQSLDFKPMSRPPQLTARPLFRKTRRPPEIPVLDEVPPIEEIPQATPPAPQEIPELVPTFRHKLTAVTITGNESVAYMVNPVNLDLIRLEKGNQIDGWVLHEVHPDAVVLGYGTEQRVRLELWADEHDEDFSVPLSGNQDAQGDFEHFQGEFSSPELRPAEPPRRPVRGPRSRVR